MSESSGRLDVDDPILAGTLDLPEEGPAAPPRSNGELVFEAPWEGRLFGLTLAMIEAQAFTWKEFQAELVAEIKGWERAHRAAGSDYAYYKRWLAAFERTLAARDLCSEESQRRRAGELARRPHGHDHR